MPKMVYDYLKALIASGEIECDAAQVVLATRFDKLIGQLTEKHLANKKSALGWFFAKSKPTTEKVCGLYIWGEVGRGKTMLMDIFFEHIPLQSRQRVHFHEFMIDIHERIHVFRQDLKKGVVKGDDPIVPVADQIATTTKLLCFDEFHVHDIADAMILGRLFTRLFAQDVIVVATSNIAPDSLYEGGLNRDLFLPFIGLLKQHVDIVRLDARTDFRLEKLQQAPIYYTPLDTKATSNLDAAWLRLCGVPNGIADHLEVKGRKVNIPQRMQAIARFGFDDLCALPLGAEDYLKIAHTFHTILMDNIPIMDFYKRNEAKRFITLIDALYDNNVKLIASAAAEPHELYQASSGNEAFSFERTASRLIEMRSSDYLAKPHGKME